ncbi:MAG: hypothetical protein EXS08_09270 [Planctomycetes bacterium]|nr:hypothetical protein [Planctomycetota bacterium]
MTTGQPKVRRLLVAVHGIGDQVRNATVQQLTRVMGAGSVPLGAFPGEPGEAHLPTLWRVDGQAWRQKWRDSDTTFAEVYWADIPRKLDPYTVQETKGWGLTVAERLRERDPRSRATARDARRNAKADPGRVEGGRHWPVDYDKTAAILEEFVEGIGLIERLGALGHHVGLPRFDAGKILNDYVNDVQVVAEFERYREQIVARFVVALWKLHDSDRDAEIHVVAHSEGTVVALLGLLHAYRGTPLYKKALTAAGITPDSRWLGQVKGLLTIGSPIDKHFVLWPFLWEDLLKGATDPSLEDVACRIPWFNYYDTGDPVGFELDTARAELAERHVELFVFPPSHDLQFTRYPLPGKAHNDYWTDTAVFAHYTEAVLGGRPVAPKGLLLARITSYLLPYVLCLALLATGVWLLHNAVLGDPLAQQSLKNPEDLGAGNTTLNVLMLTCLVAGMTVCARLARLMRLRGRALFWQLAGLAGYGLGALSLGARPKLRDWIGEGLIGWGKSPWAFVLVAAATVVACAVVLTSEEARRRGTRALACLAAIVGAAWLLALGLAPQALLPWSAMLGTLGVTLVSWVLAFALPRLGLHALVYYGGVLALLSLGGILANGAVAPSCAQPPSHWPLVAATAGFLYLWWLAALLFDLVFIWHRYICVGEGLEQMAYIRQAERESAPPH